MSEHKHKCCGKLFTCELLVTEYEGKIVEDVERERIELHAFIRFLSVSCLKSFLTVLSDLFGHTGFLEELHGCTAHILNGGSRVKLCKIEGQGGYDIFLDSVCFGEYFFSSRAKACTVAVGVHRPSFTKEFVAVYIPRIDVVLKDVDVKGIHVCKARFEVCYYVLRTPIRFLYRERAEYEFCKRLGHKVGLFARKVRNSVSFKRGVEDASVFFRIAENYRHFTVSYTLACRATDLACHNVCFGIGSFANMYGNIASILAFKRGSIEIPKIALEMSKLRGGGSVIFS